MRLDRLAVGIVLFTYSVQSFIIRGPNIALIFSSRPYVGRPLSSAYSPKSRSKSFRIQQSAQGECFRLPDVESKDRNGITSNGDQRGGSVVETTDAGVDASLAAFRAKRQQLWLDLRGTALYPHEALRFIQDQCVKHRFEDAIVERQENVLNDLIDGILVSPQMLDKIVAQSSLSDNGDDTFTDTSLVGLEYVDHPNELYTLLYVARDTNTLVASTATTLQSIPVGTVLDCNPAATTSELNVTETIDLVIQQQQWLLIDVNQRSRMSPSMTAAWLQKQMSSLLALARVASATSAFSNDDNFEESSSGLFLPSLGQTTDNGDSSSRIVTGGSSSSSSTPPINSAPTGGVAVSCTDRNAFMTLMGVLAEHEASSLTVTTADGLLVPSPLPSENSDFHSQAPSIPFSTALLLPLELNIWEAALDVHLMQS